MDKTDFDKNYYKRQIRTYAMIKGSNHHEDTTIINIREPNNRSPKYLKQKLKELKVGRDGSITVGDFNAPLSTMKRTRQNITKETEDLNNIINELDRRNTYRTLHSTTGEHTFFSGT